MKRPGGHSSEDGSEGFGSCSKNHCKPHTELAANADQIIDRPDGEPSFIEELTKTVIESGLLVDAGDRFTARGPVALLAILTTVRRIRGVGNKPALNVAMLPSGASAQRRSPRR